MKTRFGSLRVGFSESVRGAVNPWLIRLTRRGTYDLRRTLVIAGFPRSGTTWLAELVSRLPGSALLFEPLDSRAVPGARMAGFGADNFRARQEHWPQGAEFIGRVLCGEVLNRWTSCHIPVRSVPNISRWIVKFVRANPMLGWLVENFDIPPPVLLIRHPCAVFSSWVSRGWPVVSHPPPQRLRFFAEYPEHVEWTRGLRRPEEIFAARWSMQHIAPLDQLDPAEYYLCIYERLRLGGLAEAQRIFGHWGLEPPTGLDVGLERPSAKASPDAQANPYSAVDSWKRKLEPQVIDRILRVLHRFGLDFYGEDPMPDHSLLTAFAQRSRRETRSVVP